MKTLWLFLDIVPAFFSLLLFKSSKWVIGQLYSGYLQKNQDQSQQWRVLSQDTIDKPLSLPVLMTKGPRWNTHAIIGTLGPFTVEEKIRVQGDTIRQSAQSWVGCIYDFPSYRTVASFDSLDDSGQGDLEIFLPPGKYTVGLRYYNHGHQVTYPDLAIDGQRRSLETTVSGDNNQFYRHLIQRKNWFYGGLHYYIYTLLRWRRWLPEAWVRQEFLPVGAVDTDFAYGALVPGQALAIHLDPTIGDRYQTYLTWYDRSSLPLDWAEITEEEFTIAAGDRPGYYLLRFRRRCSELALGEIQAQEKELSPHLKELWIFPRR